jgi:hypothetical protein
MRSLEALMAKSAKVSKISKAEIQTAISRIKDADRLDALRAQASQRSRISSMRRDFGRRLQPLFGAGGIDIARIDQMLKEHQGEMRRLFDEQKNEAANLWSDANKEYQHTIDNRRETLKHVTGIAHLVTPIVIDPPFSIYTIPSGMETESDIMPAVSYAKIKHGDGSNTSNDKIVSTRFLFAWQNETQYSAVINANADLIYRGIIQAMSHPGLVLGGSASLSLRAKLNVYIRGTVYQGFEKLIAEVKTGTRGAIWGGTVGGDIDQKYVYDTTNLSYPEFIVREGELVIFAVILSAQYAVDDGYVMLDFASSQDYFVMCNHLVVGLLSRQGMVTGPGSNGGAFA